MANKENNKIKPFKKKPTRIRGIILPAEWDDQGNITAFSLSTTEEEEYRIISDLETERLLRLLRKNVEIIGYVKNEGKSKKIILETCSLASLE